jgi:heme-degrading monooxygenase HmoA
MSGSDRRHRHHPAQRYLDEDRASAVADQAASMFEGMAGLRSKVFMWEPESASVVNVYVWESESAAREFFTPELADRIVERYGAEPRVRFTDVSALVANGVGVGA